MKLSRQNLVLLIVFVILLSDQVLKFWIKTHMTLGEEIPVFGNWFILHFVENNGMAFGFEFAGEYGKMFLSLFRMVAVAVIGWYLFRLTRQKVPAGFLVCLAMILAGAMGNILDSSFYGLVFNHSYGQLAEFLPEGGGYAGFLHGKVVDMFYFPVIRGIYPEWMPFLGGRELIFFRPVFNIADSSITVGIFSVVLFYRNIFDEITIRGNRKHEERVADSRPAGEIIPGMEDSGAGRAEPE